MWSPVNHIPHRAVTAIRPFIGLTTTNGTTLTLSSSHIVYVVGTRSGERTPVPAIDIRVRERCSSALDVCCGTSWHLELSTG